MQEPLLRRQETLIYSHWSGEERRLVIYFILELSKQFLPAGSTKQYWILLFYTMEYFSHLTNKLTSPPSARLYCVCLLTNCFVSYFSHQFSVSVFSRPRIKIKLDLYKTLSHRKQNILEADGFHIKLLRSGRPNCGRNYHFCRKYWSYKGADTALALTECLIWWREEIWLSRRIQSW